MQSSLDQLKGNASVKGYLKRMAAQERVAHSLLFAGPENAAKCEFAKAFAELLICKEDPQGHHLHKLKSGSHPDLHLLRPEGKLGLHSIDALRRLIDEVHLPPHEAPVKVFIIEEAHRMWPYSANALLKTFEEPPLDTIIILLTHTPQALLPTILSRCRTLYFQACEEPAARSSSLAEVLEKTAFQSYKEFQQAIKGIAEALERERKEREEAVGEEMAKQMPGTLTAAQKQAFEKQAEGVASMALQVKTDELLEDVMAWYRDLHLLKSGGDTSRLFYRGRQAELAKALQSAPLPPLELVMQAAADAKLALERSTPIAHVLENLFLKLNRI
jgi:DNA polymerase-3 subunit delta'